MTTERVTSTIAGRTTANLYMMELLLLSSLTYSCFWTGYSWLLRSLDGTTSFVASTIVHSNLWGHLKGTDYQKRANTWEQHWFYWSSCNNTIQEWNFS